MNICLRKMLIKEWRISLAHSVDVAIQRGVAGRATRAAKQKAHFRILDLTRLNKLRLASSFDLPKGHWPESAWAMGFSA
jgi:hypothetical protein